MDLKYGQVTGLSFKDKQEEIDFINRLLKDVLKPEELESLKKEGVPFGLWAKYRNLYRWAPTLISGIILQRPRIGIGYLNGESGPENLPFTKDLIDTPRPLPSRINFFPMMNGIGRPYIVYFNEYELMDAFEKLGAKGEIINIEFDPREPRQSSQLRVYNDRESIELKKTIVSDR